MGFRKEFSRLSKAESAETLVGEGTSKERRWNRILSLVAQPKEDGGFSIQPFGNYNRALNGMEMASIGLSWMETNTVEKKMIPASPSHSLWAISDIQSRISYSNESWSRGIGIANVGSRGLFEIKKSKCINKVWFGSLFCELTNRGVGGAHFFLSLIERKTRHFHRGGNACSCLH